MTPDDLTKALNHLPPLERITAAAALADTLERIQVDAMTQADTSGISRTAIGRAAGVSQQAASKRLDGTDRKLLDEALTILIGDGVTSVSREVAKGLPGTEIKPKARRVIIGMRHLQPEAVTGEDLDVLTAALERAKHLCAGEDHGG